LEVAESLFTNGHYLHCLYFGHLILEKALKGYWVYKNKTTPPKIHDLLKLALKTSINLPESNLRFLDELNKFNIEARYPEYKLEM
jgi:HEPN domain-containing protein